MQIKVDHVISRELFALGPFADLTPHGYPVIACDSPWRFETWSPAGEDRSPQKHYRVMKLDEICALPVAELAAPDTWLFFWVPGHHLEQAFTVLRAWGFRYSGVAFTWVKLNARAVDALWLDASSFRMGLGLTTRKSTELCLLAKRGKPARKRKDVRELIISPLREHSRKPDEFYARVRAFADGPYVELFAREIRPGWDAWGDEIHKFRGALA